MSDVKKTSRTSGVVHEFGRSPRAVVAETRPAPSDAAGITGEARELGRALHAVEASAEVRAERVRALRAQIAEGTYNPDPREIARKMIERGF